MPKKTLMPSSETFIETGIKKFNNKNEVQIINDAK